MAFKPLGKVDKELPYEPVYIAFRNAFNIVCRVAGSAADHHTIVVVGSRYDRVGKSMYLSQAVIHWAVQLPAGNLVGLFSHINRLHDTAAKESHELPVEIAMDVTRNPVAWEGFPTEPDLFMVTTTGLIRDKPPYRLVGRLLLLSQLQILLRDRKLAVALPEDHEDSLVITKAKLEMALSNAQLRLPKVDLEEAFLSETGAEDDLAICAGLAILVAQERMIPAEDLRFRKTRQAERRKWVY